MSLDRLFRRPAGPSPDLAAALDDLAHLAGSRPVLAGPAGMLARVLSAAFSTRDDDRGRSAGGFPSFDPDASPLRRRALAILTALAPENPAARNLHRAIRRGDVDLLGWAKEVMAGQTEAVSSWGDPGLAATVLRLTLLPSLSRLDDSPSEATGGPCPRCRSVPLLAELRGLEREVRLRCGLCAADWPGGRLLCPTCGESDHRKLSTRHVEGEADRCRLLLCATCGGRLKLVATLAPLSPPALIVADLATIHLDLIDLDREDPP